MSLSLTETIAQPATDALHEAIRVAWQAGYDCALMDADKTEQYGLRLVKESGE
jgi:hypothetical protein